MLIQTTVSCPVKESFRVQQVRGMFDLPAGLGATERFSVEVPAGQDPWNIGLIVGPSGSGKTSIARRAFGEAMVHNSLPWPAEAAIIDGFGKADIRTITQALSAVGLNSPPAWLRPYHVLSNGEKFRADLARLLLSPDNNIAVMDEFTSVVDRTVAQVGSAAVARAIRSGAFKKRFVAVSCHYDIAQWLCPDWIVDMATQTLARGCLQRPPLSVEIRRCERKLWRSFARHHYLSSKLPGGAYYCGLLNGTPIAFAGITQVTGFTGYKRFSRIVVLPDYQGLGVGGKFRNAVAEIAARQPGCQRLSLITSHPAMIRSCQADGQWKLRAVSYSNGAAGLKQRGIDDPAGHARRICSFTYVGTENQLFQHRLI
jgi:ABC-type dipeptide/oligopeptide/nickel transport system ATPase subunit